MTVDKGLHAAGISIAIAMHVVVAGGVLFADSSCLAEATTRDVDDARYIQASLAMKGDEEEAQDEGAREEDEPLEPEPEPEQPQEQEEPEPEPEEPDQEPAPEPEPDTQPRPNPEADPHAEPEHEADEFDPQDILDRNRALAEADDDVELRRPTTTEAGALDGSEWGTELDAEGDPYVGELRGRVERAWSLPSLERGEDLAAWGCVRLEEDGTIADRELEEPSASRTLNRSVVVALENTTDMQEPVPEHLLDLLVDQGVCFTFRP